MNLAHARVPVRAAFIAAVLASCVFADGFKVTFGVKNHNHGVSWSGGVHHPSQVRQVMGWRLHDEDELRATEAWDLTLRSVGGDVPAKGLVLDVVTPETQPVSLFSRRGDIDFTPASIPFGSVFEPRRLGGDVTIERVPFPRKVSTPEYEDDSPALLRTRAGTLWMAWVGFRVRGRDGFNLDGADEVFVAHSSDEGESWSEPEALSAPGDHFRTALGEDSDGGVWIVYGRQERLESGDFNLYGQRFDGEAWAAPIRLTDDPNPDVFHRLAGDRKGQLHLVWMGFREGPGGAPKQSDILYRRFADGRWAATVNLTESAENDWTPSVSADSAGRAWVAWDAYSPSAGGPANYNVYLRPVENGKPGETAAVADTPLAEMRASVAVDGRDQV